MLQVQRDADQQQNPNYVINLNDDEDSSDEEDEEFLDNDTDDCDTKHRSEDIKPDSDFGYSSEDEFDSDFDSNEEFKRVQVMEKNIPEFRYVLQHYLLIFLLH